MAWIKPSKATIGKIGNKSFIKEVDGDLWITVNAFHDGTNWRRVDKTKFSFGLQIQGTNNIPLESVPGCTYWRAVPSSDDIIGDFSTYGGWELSHTVTGYRDVAIGGINLELDGSGNSTAFGRLNQVENCIYLTTNAFFDGASWVRDDASKGAAGIRITPSGAIEKLTAAPGSGPFTWASQSVLSQSPPADIVDSVDGLQGIPKKKGYFAVVLNDENQKTSQYVCIEAPILQMMDDESKYPSGKILDDYLKERPLDLFDHTLFSIIDTETYTFGIISHEKGSTIEIESNIIKVLSNGETPTYINFDIIYMDPISMTIVKETNSLEADFSTLSVELEGSAVISTGLKWRKIGE